MDFKVSANKVIVEYGMHTRVDVNLEGVDLDDLILHKLDYEKVLDVIGEDACAQYFGLVKKENEI